MRIYLLAVLIFGAYVISPAQGYHAAHGSNYASSLNVANDPASILSSPYKWDLTLIGTQLKSVSNAYTLRNYSLLSLPSDAEFTINNGKFARKADLDFNTNLFNARISLTPTRAIAFGANLRGYTRLRTSSFNVMDTLHTITDFFLINQDITNYQADFISSSWLELFGSYGQTIVDNDQERLNAGITLKVSRGLSGGFARVQDINVNKTDQPEGPVFEVASGAFSYGYSSNYDPWLQHRTQSAMDFMKTSQAGISFDAGVEYLIRSQAVGTWYDNEDDYEYDWKIGISVLDIGFNQYRYGLYSSVAANPLPDLTNMRLEEKFTVIQGIPEFRDSLITTVSNFRALGKKITVINPMRLVINADRYIRKDFYINAEASINLSSLAGDQRFFVWSLTFLTVTPRWETKNLGVYLPVQYNNVGKFWVGAAFKAGPLLFGTHNLSNLFSKNNVQNGGGYLAIILHPWEKKEDRADRQYDCPKL